MLRSQRRPPPIAPDKQAELDLKRQTLQATMQKNATQAKQADEALKTKNNIAVLQLAKEVAIHPDAVQDSQSVLNNPSIAQYSQ